MNTALSHANAARPDSRSAPTATRLTRAVTLAVTGSLGLLGPAMVLGQQEGEKKSGNGTEFSAEIAVGGEYDSNVSVEEVDAAISESDYALTLELANHLLANDTTQPRCFIKLVQIDKSADNDTEPIIQRLLHVRQQLTGQLTHLELQLHGQFRRNGPRSLFLAFKQPLHIRKPA